MTLPVIPPLDESPEEAPDRPAAVRVESTTASPVTSQRTPQRTPTDAASPNEHRHLAIDATASVPDPDSLAPETGGQAGLEPTRYGDWEKRGRCTDF